MRYALSESKKTDILKAKRHCLSCHSEKKRRKETIKNFWRDKGVGIMSSIASGIILAFWLIRFGLK